MDVLTKQLNSLVLESAQVCDALSSQEGKRVIVVDDVVITFEDGIVLHRMYEKERSMFRLVRVFYAESDDILLIKSLYFAEVLNEMYDGYQFIKMN